MFSIRYIQFCSTPAGYCFLGQYIQLLSSQRRYREGKAGFLITWGINRTVRGHVDSADQSVCVNQRMEIFYLLRIHHFTFPFHVLSERHPAPEKKQQNTDSTKINRPGYNQGMSPITKIEIAIPIPIFIRNWECNRDPDPNLKSHLRSDRDRSSTIARSFARSFYLKRLVKTLQYWE